MIHRTEPRWQWQKSMAEVITDPADLFRQLALDPMLIPGANSAAEKFSLRVPRRYVDLMAKGDLDDPLLRQILPISQELAVCEGFSDDPVGDANSVAEHGLLHKYHGRVLLITTAACAIHCRFCFRRNFSYSDHLADPVHWHKTVAYIASHPEIHEVILSGGDPLMMSDQRLSGMLQLVATIGHVKRIRIHSRMPVVLPERITPPLLELFAQSRLKVVMVLHSNHPNEVVDDLAEATKQLTRVGVTLLNQSVLLKGVNDDSSILAALSEQLFAIGVMPYYLHLLDRAQGVAHFEVSEDNASKLYHQLMAKLPGYLVPRMVREIEGALAKVPLSLLELE
ncbi:MAG: EF-P beta-lysylation protein EpmB [Candidatus Polarisedimenticolaceae bacterium]|nr:EF-P beta-lysylation protein EpmB [Candidatus Polarisedimenticolaceae bacterium]